MRIIGINGVGKDFVYNWPTVQENFNHYIDYRQKPPGLPPNTAGYQPQIKATKG